MLQQIKLKTQVLRYITSCRLVNTYRGFEGHQSLHNVGQRPRQEWTSWFRTGRVRNYRNVDDYLPVNRLHHHLSNLGLHLYFLQKLWVQLFCKAITKCNIAMWSYTFVLEELLRHRYQNILHVVYGAAAKIPSRKDRIKLSISVAIEQGQFSDILIISKSVYHGSKQCGHCSQDETSRKRIDRGDPITWLPCFSDITSFGPFFLMYIKKQFTFHHSPPSCQNLLGRYDLLRLQ